MPRFLANRFVELCGLTTSVLTAVVVLLIEQWLHFSIFTMSFWVIVPVGALLTGCAAASGYYIGAVLTDRKPGKQLLVSMVIVSGGTFFLIYYLQYLTMEVDGRPVSHMVAFSTFLQVMLTKAQYSFMRSSSAHFEVGAFGYVLAALQFAGFIAGGFALYLGLTAKPFCDRCEKYLKKLTSVRRIFADAAAFEPFSQRLYSLSPPSAEYLHILREPHTVPKPKPGAVALDWTLLGCPACRDQLVVETPKILSPKKEWSSVSKFERKFKIEARIPLLSEFNAAKSARQ